MNSTDNTGKIQETRFKKGTSGNPEGRPKGSRNKTTLAIQALLDGEAEAITRRVIEAAKDGDLTAAKLCLDRLAPAPKDSPIIVDIPLISSLADILAATAAVVNAVAAGEITPSTGKVLVSMIGQLRQSIETQELEQRVAALEERV